MNETYRLLDSDENLGPYTGKDSNSYRQHALGLYILWGFGADLGILAAMRFKNNRYYQWIHAIIFTVIDLYTLIFQEPGDGALKGLQKYSGFASSWHETCGELLIYAMVVVHVSGMFLQLITEKTSGRQDYIGKMKVAHTYLSYGCYILAKLAVFFGCYWHYKLHRDTELYWIFLFLLFNISLYIAGFLYKRQRESSAQKYIMLLSNIEKQNGIEMPNTQTKAEQIVQLVNQNLETEEIMKVMGKNFKFCFYQNKICDLTNYFHPGGQYIMTMMNGRDMDRCFYGNLALEGDNRAGYVHSYEAEKKLLKMSVGQVDLPDESNILNKYCQQSDIWNVTFTKELTTNTKVFYLSSVQYKIKNYNKGIQWIGRCFEIKTQNNPQRRQYTIVRSLTQENIEYRKLLAEFARSNFEGQTPQKLIEFSESIPFAIKKYAPEDKTFTGHLFKQYETQGINMQGPYGRGIFLKEKVEGDYIIVCGGTGIFPFYDLLDQILNKIIYEIAKKQKGQQWAQDNIDPNNIGYENIFNNVTFKMYAAFNSKEEFYGRYEYLEPIMELQEKQDLKLFEFVGRVKGLREDDVSYEITTQRFDQEFFRVRQALWRNMQKLWICGSSLLNAQVFKVFEKSIDPYKIEFI